ncbi:phthiocerol/phthiodiolone dimycocerosyl transferase family protein [Amycolatopsis jejuensis]|uniref:phthiocerol/phthiodiolone dimycocerosyl transferase family protein n=1 Tax=Amycolatopsis jejuensis TaxID=330084 RepID=UPI00052784BC|nr:hypothetical protein [Amycolatopsis jejuensis]
MTLTRQLDEVEVVWKEDYISAVTEWRGTVDVGVLQQAAELLSLRYPTLRGFAEHGPSGYMLRVNLDSPPPFLVLGETDDLLHELRYRPDFKHALARFVVAPGTDGGKVAIQASHAVSDSPSIFAMLRDLWHLYLDLAKGVEVIETPGPLPQPPSTFMRDIWTQADLENLEERRARHTSLSLDSNPVDPDAVPEDVIPRDPRIRLTQEETGRLVKAARNCGTSVHALMCGALSVALCGSESPNQTHYVSCTSMVDIRNRVNPPIGPTDTAVINFPVRCDVAIPPGADPVDVGSAIKYQLDSEISRRFPGVPAPRAVPSLPRRRPEPGDHPIEFAIGNAGVIPPFPGTDDLTVVDLRLIADLVHPYVTGLTSPYIVISTFNGRLAIDGIIPQSNYSQSGFEALMQRIFREVTDIAARHGDQ